MVDSLQSFSFRTAIAAIIVCGAQVPWTTSDVAFGQQPKGHPKAAPAAASRAQAPVTVPLRTESIVYDAWTVTCQDPRTRDGKRICSAILTLEFAQGDQRRTLGRWIIAKDVKGVLMAVLQTPMFQTKSGSTGVSIKKGVEFTLGHAPKRQLSYVTCEPQRCEASVAMDAQMIKDAIGAASASIAIFGKDGTRLTINVPSIKGIDKAVSNVNR
jgi:invasion protein IalB